MNPFQLYEMNAVKKKKEYPKPAEERNMVVWPNVLLLTQHSKVINNFNIVVVVISPHIGKI